MLAKSTAGLVVAIACAAPILDARFSAEAHGTHHRPRIGASHKTPTGAPETWGTYCITELAPLFREAIQLAQANQSTAPATIPANPDAPVAAAGSQPVGTVNIKPFFPVPAQKMTPQPSNLPLLKPLPPSLSAKPQQTTEKITIYLARKIVTMDPGWPTATAVAVKDGRILSVGTLEDLQPWMKRYPYEIDKRFAKQVIYPGFVEAHGHPVMGSVAISLPPLSFFPLRNPYGPDFPGVKTSKAAMRALAKYVKDAKPGQTVLTWGYDVVAMGGDLLTSADLDAISKTQPIVVWDASEHYVFANSAAIEKYGITNDLVAKTIGAGKNSDGSSNGQFLGTEAAKIIVLKPLSELLTPEEGKRRLRYLGALMQQAGITATGDLFYGGVNLNIVLSLHSDTPVGVPSPLYEVWTAVNRIGQLSGKTHAPAERVRNVERAMRMVTIDAAYTLGVDDRIGSIEAGKYADFVVLDKDPKEVSAKTIKDIKVIATITAGRTMLTSQTRKPDWQFPPQ